MIRKIALHRRIASAIAAVVLRVLALPLLLANRTRRPSATTSRILVLEPWGIGDLVLSTGALRALRAHFPTADIAVLAKSYAESVVVTDAMANRVISYDFPWTAFENKYRLTRYRFRELLTLVRALRRARYDLVLNARADIRNNVLGALVGAGTFVSLRCGLGDFLADEVVQADRDSHRSDDWRSVIERVIGPSPAAAIPRLAVDAELRDRVSTALRVERKAGRLVIGIHPGARIAVRRWGLDRFAAVGNAIHERYDARLIVFAEPDGYGADIPLRFPFVVAQRGLSEMMAVLAACDVVLCNDSGPMHIANALGIPVVALFGPTKLEWFGPRGGPSRIVRIDDVACRPCFDVCRFEEPHCMTRLTEAAVLDAMDDLLRSEGRLAASSMDSAAGRHLRLARP